jgi:ketosteroid isomerase-like protein
MPVVESRSTPGKLISRKVQNWPAEGESFMKRLLFLMVGICLLISSASAQAQTWSAAEKEVLQGIEDCNRAWKEENLEAQMACLHDDFVGFGYGAPGTFNKADARKNAPLIWANSDLVEWWTKPLAIRIVGDVAIIHYYYYYTLSRDQDGKEIRSRYRWTDIMVKQDGKWLQNVFLSRPIEE